MKYVRIIGISLDSLKEKVSTKFMSDTNGILFCGDPFDSKAVDNSFKGEYAAATKNRFATFILNQDFFDNDYIGKAIKHFPKMKNKQLVIFRGWMMSPDEYTRFWNALFFVSMCDWFRQEYIRQAKCHCLKNTVFSFCTTKFYQCFLIGKMRIIRKSCRRQACLQK